MPLVAIRSRSRVRAVDPLEGVEHGRHQHGAALVRLDVVDVVAWIRLERHPLASLLVPLANHAAQRAAIALERLAELRRELAEHVIADQSARGSPSSWCSTSSPNVKRCSSATISAKPSWKAATSGLVSSR